MFVKPSQSFSTTFTTCTPSTGAATNADSTPTAVVYKNGSVDATFTLTVATTGTTGHYKVTGTVPSGYAAGDMFDVMVAVTMATVVGRASIGTWQVDTKRNSDLQDLAATSIVSAGAITTSGGKVSGVILVDTLTTYTGNTLQTGDSFARIGAAGVGLTAVALTATQAFNNTGTWTGIVTRVTLVDTTTTNTDMRGTNGAVTSLTGIATATNVSNAQTALSALIAAVQADTDDLQTRIPAALVGGRMDSNIGAVSAGAIVTGSFAAGTTLPRVTLVDTTTANTDMRGTDNAITSLAGIATATNVSNAQAALAALIAAVQADTDDLQTRLPAALIGGRLDVYVGAMATGVIVSSSFAAGTTLPRVTLVDTTTTNTDMRGTNGAITSLAGIATAADVLAAVPTDYQQRGVAVTLPATAPDGYGGSFSGDISGLTDDQAEQLAFIAEKSALISTGQVVVVSPVSTTGAAIELVAGDDYRHADGRALPFSSADWPDLTGGTVRWKCAGLSIVATLTGARALYVEITGTATTSFLGGKKHELEATLANGHVATILRGQTTFLAQL